jgi:hypothetical protein
MPPVSTEEATLSRPGQKKTARDVDLAHASTVLETKGSKRSLKLLRKVALVALCSIKLHNPTNHDYNKDMVDVLVSKLTTWVCRFNDKNFYSLLSVAFGSWHYHSGW